MRPRLQVQFPCGSFNFAQRKREGRKHPGTQITLKSSASCLTNIWITNTEDRPQRVDGSGKYQSPLTLYHADIFEPEIWHMLGSYICSFKQYISTF